MINKNDAFSSVWNSLIYLTKYFSETCKKIIAQNNFENLACWCDNAKIATCVNMSTSVLVGQPYNVLQEDQPESVVLEDQPENALRLNAC